MPDNAFIEAFNGRLRAECLNAYWFLSLANAEEKSWRLGIETTTTNGLTVRPEQGPGSAHEISTRCQPVMLTNPGNSSLSRGYVREHSKG